MPIPFPAAPLRARRRFASSRRPAGLTLPELLAAVAIVAILAAIVVSIAGGMVHASRAASARAALLDTYQVAIRHAATRGVHVVACPRAGDGCLDDIDWSAGWFVFEDRDRDRLRDGGERVVGSWPGLGERTHLRSTVGRKLLVFNPSGGNAGSNVTFTLCDGRGPAHAVQLVIANDGRLRETPAPRPAASGCAGTP